MPINSPNNAHDQEQRSAAPRGKRAPLGPRRRPLAETHSSAVRNRRVRTGFTLGAILVAAAALAIRLLRAQALPLDLAIFAVPVATAMLAGGLVPAISIMVVEAAIAATITSALAGWLARAEIVGLDLIVIAVLNAALKARSTARELAGLDAILRAILDCDATGIIVLNRAGRALFVGREAARMCGPELRAGQSFEAMSDMGLAMADGKPITLDELFHDYDPRPAASGGGRSASRGPAFSGPRDLLLLRSSQQRVWFECQAVPVRIAARRAALIALLTWDNQPRARQQAEASRNESQRQRREEREAVLSEISRHLRGSLDARRIQEVAVQQLGAALRADRCFFLLFHVGEHQAVVGPQWTASGVPIVAAEYEPVAIDIERLYRRGLTRLLSDIRASSVPASILTEFEDHLGVRSAINVPLFENGRLAGALVVAMADQPRAWSTDDVALTESVASQTRFVIEAARLLAAERARAEREEMSNTIGNAVRSTIDPSTIQREATNALGRVLGVDRCYYIHYDLDAKKAIVGPDFARPPDNLSLRGEYSLPASDLGPFERMFAPNTLVVDDVSDSDPILASSMVTLRSESVRAFIRVPIFAGQKPTAALIVAMTGQSRSWSADEVALVESVASQTCSAVTNALLIARESGRAQREQLLNRISAQVGQTESASDAHSAAAGVLGATLEADRCYLVQLEYYRGAAVTTGQYCRPGLAPMPASCRLDDADIGWLLARVRSGEPFMATDVRRQMPEQRDKGGLLHAQPHRGLMAMPQLAGGRIDSIIVLATVDRPRIWSEAEVSLVRDAAGHMRGALAAALIHERERRIASILQEALLPSLPERLPGLDVATHYKAALGESRIGGDFYDAFAIGPAKTVLCVGDVSGKGLTAAAQLSSVRNMLRAMLYPGNTNVAEAVAQLNQIIAQHRLLNGFATAFVSIYDSASRRLSYVSCGHEPAILLRAAGDGPTILPTTSAAIGLYEGESFDECSATMGPGDLLLLYTDGVSEAGRVGTAMLGSEGVAQIMVQAAMQGNSDPKAIMVDIVARVEQQTQGVQRDDMCLLLARSQ